MKDNEQIITHILFNFDVYEPNGGGSDIVGLYSSLDEAKESAIEMMSRNKKDIYDIYEIVDVVNRISYTYFASSNTWKENQIKEK